MKTYSGKDFESRNDLKEYAAKTYGIELSARFSMPNMLETFNDELAKREPAKVQSHYQPLLAPTQPEEKEPAHKLTVNPPRQANRKPVVVRTKKKSPVIHPVSKKRAPWADYVLGEK